VPGPMRMKYAEMNSPNNEVITARNTHKAMRARRHIHFTDIA